VWEAPKLVSIDARIEWLAQRMRGKKAAILTGAGCSTESGIPDYRGPGTRRRAKNPLEYREFVQSDAARRRYWARSVLGWTRVAAAKPNSAHKAIAALQRAGRLTGLVTQNVDRLHQAAGATDVVELHGALHEVICLECGWLGARAEVQAELLARNPGWDRQAAVLAPDGDAELEAVDGFVVVECPTCAGVLKPHVVFFGESVPVARVDAAWRIVNEADVLLVVGSSMTVFSGYRFAKGAAKRGLPVVILNLGPTRADPHACLRIDASAGAALQCLATSVLA